MRPFDHTNKKSVIFVVMIWNKVGLKTQYWVISYNLGSHQTGRQEDNTRVKMTV